MEIKGMMRRKTFSLFFIVLGILSPKEIFAVVCEDDPSFQFSLLHGANVTKGCAWIARTTDESKRQSRAQKYCAKKTSSGARNAIYNACPVACGSPCSRFNEDSSVIENDVVWHDSKGKNIKANRCGTISTKKVGGFWYMLGSEASRKWVSKGRRSIFQRTLFLVPRFRVLICQFFCDLLCLDLLTETSPQSIFNISFCNYRT